MRFARFFGFLAFAALTTPVGAQPPTADDVQALQTKYAEERAKSLADGADKAFPPGLVERADDLAKRADAARSAGRLFQASELFRQARWQLPYLPTKLPEHVSRVFGNFRLRHGMEATAAAFSPDGRFLATGSSDRTVKLWDLANGREVRSYGGHGEQVRAVAFSPDGKLVASAGLEPEIHFWKTDTGELVRKVTGPGIYVTSLAFSRDGTTLASGHAGKIGGGSGYLVLTDVASGQIKRQRQDEFRSHVTSVSFNAKGDVIAVGTAEPSMRLYSYPKVVENVKEQEYWSHQDNSSGPIADVAFSADDKSLIRCALDGIKVYAVPLPAQAFQVSAPKRSIANPDSDSIFVSALTSIDSKTLIAGSSDGMLRLIDLETGQTLSKLRGHSGPIRSLALHPKGSRIASVGGDCTVRLWDFDVVLQARDYLGHDGPVWSANFSPDGRKIVSAGNDQTIRIWDVGTAAPLHVLKGHRGPVTMAAFLPDGKRIVSGGADRTLKIWDADGGAIVRDLTGHAGTVTAFDVSPDGKRLVSGGADRLVKIWDTETGKEVLTVPGQTSVVSAIAIHPSGDRFAVGNVDQTIGLYDMTGKQLRRWPAHGIAVSGLSFSPNGKLLASCGADSLVRIWTLDAPLMTPITLMGHNGPLSGVAFRKDSQHLVSCGADLLVKLWKLEGDGGKEQQTYRGHRDWVASAAFSKDGHYVCSASVDRTIKIWEITSKDVPLVPEHTGAVAVIAFSPDGKTFATGGNDRTIKIWDRVTGDELTTIRGLAGTVVSMAYAPDGKSLASSITRYPNEHWIRFWDSATGKELPRSDTQQASFQGMVNSSLLLSMTPDGKRMLVWTSGAPQAFATISAYDLEGNLKFTFNDSRKIHSLCFSDDGRRAATGAPNGIVRVWDLDKDPATVIPGGDWAFFDEKTAVADLALTPNGKTIVVTSEKGEIKIGDVAKREIVKSFKGHESKISSCVVSPDGKRFVTLDGDNLIKLWDLAKGEELRRWNLTPMMENRAASIVSLAFSHDGKHLLAGNTNSTMLLLETP